MIISIEYNKLIPANPNHKIPSTINEIEQLASNENNELKELKTLEKLTPKQSLRLKLLIADEKRAGLFTKFFTTLSGLQNSFDRKFIESKINPGRNRGPKQGSKSLGAGFAKGSKMALKAFFDELARVPPVQNQSDSRGDEFVMS